MSSNILDYGITSDDELKKICNDLNIKLNFIDFEHKLLNYKSKDGGYILNIGDQSGTHWTCMYVLDKKSYYFDSYSAPPNNEIILFCSNNNITNLNYNNKFQFQKLNQDLCGIYCVCCLYYLQNEKNKKLSDRFDKFSNNLLKE